MKNKFLLLLLLLMAVSGAPALAQLIPSQSVVSAKVVEEQTSLPAGSSASFVVAIKIKEGWHTQSHTPSMEGLIATELSLTPPHGVTIGKIGYPAGEEVTFAFSKTPLSSYVDEALIIFSLSTGPDLAPGSYQVEATLTVQACDDHNCLTPSDLDLPFTIKVVPHGATVELVNREIFNKAAAHQIKEKPSGSSIAGVTDIGDYLAEQGLLLTYLLIFLGGLALNLTPCVYPLIPVTVSYFGGESEKKRGHIVIHATLYLLGMAAMYSSLGLGAAMTGALFGATLQHPAVTLLIVATMVVLALSMFGLYDIRPPAFLSAIGGKNREGFVGTFMMGLTVGIIAAPCIGPFVLGLLTFVGEKQDPFLGFSMFFVLALGLGIPFVALALFSGSVSRLPRSGMWMIWVKKVFGFILLAMAIFFAEPLIPANLFGYLLGFFIIGSGLYLGFFGRIPNAGTGFKAFQTFLGVVFIVAGAAALYFERPAMVERGITWEKATVTSLDNALSSGKPVMVDFTAEWCVPCKELEHLTFVHKEVVALSAEFVTLQVDLTKAGDEEAEAIKKRYKALGVPTVLIFDRTGTLRSDLSFTGFINGPKLLERMKKGAAGAKSE